MTEASTGDLVREFISALNKEARWAIVDHVGINSDRTILISRAARDHGWTARELAAVCNEGSHLANLDEAIDKRLLHCADGTIPRPAPAPLAKFVQPLPWCGECQEAGRWRLDPDTQLPIGHCDCWTDPSGVLPQVSATLPVVQNRTNQ